MPKIKIQSPQNAVVRLTCLLALLILSLTTAKAAGPVTVITAGTLIDPGTGKEDSKQTILIESGKITAIGRDLAVPADAIRIDLSHEVVLPGLMDAHTHLLANIDAKWDLADTWIMTLQRRAGYRAIVLKGKPTMLWGNQRVVRPDIVACCSSDIEIRCAKHKLVSGFARCAHAKRRCNTADRFAVQQSRFQCRKPFSNAAVPTPTLEIHFLHSKSNCRTAK